VALGLRDRLVETGRAVDLRDADRRTRARVTNSGQPCSPAKSTIFLRAADSCWCHSPPDHHVRAHLEANEVNTRFMYSLSWPTAEASTPAPTYGTPDSSKRLQGAVLAVGPCRREDDVDLTEGLGHGSRFADDDFTVSGVEREHHAPARLGEFSTSGYGVR